jgi:hypothetical protein
MIVFVLILFGCKSKPMNPLGDPYRRLESVSQESWDALARKKIFFGHQSVGQNIVDGLEKVTQAFPSVRLRIRETANLEDFKEPVFAHAKIGQNRDPKGKMDDFQKLLDNGIGKAADIAFFKLCFVDIDRTTDINALIDHYDKILADLSARYPNLTIVPVTVPLTAPAPGVKAWIKRLLGREPDLKAGNIPRNLMNAHIRDKYGAAVWDLADAEATTAKGTKATFRDGEGTYFLLNPAYTSDGGHLNQAGSQVVAIDLLLRLVSLISR